MKNLKSFIAILLCLSLLAPAAQAASDQQQDTQGTVAQDVLIIIQQEQVRFTAQKAVAEMQLQVFDQTGQLVYDSGTVTEPELIWALRQAGGEAVRSGLYAYALSLKEAGAAEARVRRGHFIVDRASERDGQTDRLWITSRNDSGVGTELTVARNEGVTIAGTSGSGDRAGLRTGDGEQAEATEGESRSRSRGSAKETSQSTTSVLGKTTIQGTEDPLLEINHTGTAGHPAIWFKQDGATRAYMWWDRYNNRLNLGTPSVNPIMSLLNDGRVGIGTTNPTSRLEIAAQDGLRITGYQPFLTLQDTNTGGRLGRIQNANGDMFFATHGFIGQAPWAAMVIRGTASEGSRVEIYSQDGLNIVGYQPFLTLTDSHDGWTFRGRIQNVRGGLNFQTHDLTNLGGSAMFIENSTQFVGIGTTAPQTRLDVAGITRTHMLQITGGADFAENFDVSAPAVAGDAGAGEVAPGMVVSIDPARPGRLALTTRAYDRRVAGIISGAGGVNPGMMMSQEGTLAHGSHPVALSGRVYCQADASHGAIEPGDLLTTSDTPGHAMKVVDPAKAQGAIIGKAMTSLKEGKGLVLVLVTLQ